MGAYFKGEQAQPLTGAKATGVTPEAETEAGAKKKKRKAKSKKNSKTPQSFKDKLKGPVAVAGLGLVVVGIVAYIFWPEGAPEIRVIDVEPAPEGPIGGKEVTLEPIQPPPPYGGPDPDFKPAQKPGIPTPDVKDA